MSKRPHQVSRHSTVKDGFIDRRNAEKICQKKLKRTSTLYKKVLLKNTLEFVQNSKDNCFPFGNDENYEPKVKILCEDEEEIDYILSEMIFPISTLPSPEELLFDWPQPVQAKSAACEEEFANAAIVPDIEIIEHTPDDDFINTIFSDRTNCTVTKLSSYSQSSLSEKEKRPDQKCNNADFSDLIFKKENVIHIKAGVCLIPSEVKPFHQLHSVHNS